MVPFYESRSPRWSIGIRRQELSTQGRFQGAIQRYQQAEGLWQHLAAPEQLARVAQELGTAYYGGERYGDALGANGKALRLYREVASQGQEARVLNSLGMTYEA